MLQPDVSRTRVLVRVQIWKAKKDADKEVAKSKDKGAQRMHMKDFLYTYFLEGEKTMEKITEIAYNLMWGCKRYDYDADIELFVNVLMNEVRNILCLVVIWSASHI